MRNGNQPEPYVTIPEAARRLRLGPKIVRRAARAGLFPVYDAGSGWPRVKLSEVDAGIRSTRVRPSAHARTRVDELLDQEAGGG